MGKNKLARFRYNEESGNVIQRGKDLYTSIKGNWHKFFGNSNKITLEIGCGRGEYTTGLASVFPERNFIGVDIKGARLWKGSTVANEEKLYNVAFLRTQIRYVEEFFVKGEASEIWITFPDPRPRDSDEKHRLPGPVFLNRYKNILEEGGWVRLKTDNLALFQYTLESLKEAGEGNSLYPFYITDLEYTFDLYSSAYLDEHYHIQTTYERKFLSEGFKINYLKFKLFTNPSFRSTN